MQCSSITDLETILLFISHIDVFLFAQHIFYNSKTWTLKRWKAIRQEKFLIIHLQRNTDGVPLRGAQEQVKTFQNCRNRELSCKPLIADIYNA